MTDAVRAGVDHEIDAAPLAVDVEFAALIEDGRRDREDAAVGFCGWGHDEDYLRWL